jgi:putative addiction module component (TIGR02574 family)
MKTISASHIVEIPIDQRIQLVEDIWDSIAAIPQSVKIPDWHKKELEKRLEDFHADPEGVSPWAEVKERIPG